MSDPDRFRDAQDRDYPAALAEIRAGRKTTHWMWYIFPQLRGLGRSSAAEYYGIEDLDEARAYLDDPVLGARLLEITGELLSQPCRDAEDIFGRIDAGKLRSCMTLFALADPDEPLFRAVLSDFFGGRADRTTERMVGDTVIL